MQMTFDSFLAFVSDNRSNHKLRDKRVSETFFFFFSIPELRTYIKSTKFGWRNDELNVLLSTCGQDILVLNRKH